MSVLFVLRTVWRGVVTLAAVTILYAAVDALRAGEPNTTARILLYAVAAASLAVAVAVWSRHAVAVYVQLIGIPFLLMLYVLEYRHVSPVDRMLHVEEMWRLVGTRVAQGPVAIQYSPANYRQNPEGGVMLPNGERIYPLGGVADLPTIMCKEGARPFAEYVADELGFNNPKGLWGKPADVVLLGDSMAYGACLPNRDHFVAQIRERFPATLNLSQGGVGPLIELAFAREFLTQARPKYLFYFYDENNDLYLLGSGEADLALEYRHPILRRYAEDDHFSQRLYQRRSEVNAAVKTVVDQAIDAGLAHRTPMKTFGRFLGLTSTRASLQPIELKWTSRREHAGPAVLASLVAPALAASRAGSDGGPGPARIAPAPLPRMAQLPLNPLSPIPATSAGPMTEAKLMDLFRNVYAKTVQAAKDVGATFVFVSIPAQGTVCDNIEHPLKKQVRKLVAQSGVDIIDLEKDVRSAIVRLGREAVFAVPPCGGHFSEAGYRILGDRVRQYVDIKEAMARPQGLEALDRQAMQGWRIGPAPARKHDGGREVVATYKANYDPYVPVNTVFAETAEEPKQRQGAAILGNAYTRQKGGTALRVSVSFSAYSPGDNEIVAAIFVGGSTKPSQIGVQPVKAGSVASVVVDHEIEPITDSPTSIEVRVGLRRPGTLYINGNDRQANSSVAKPFWMIEELNEDPFELTKSDQLLYVGTDPPRW